MAPDMILLSEHSHAKDGLSMMLEAAIGCHDYVHTYVELPIALLIIEVAKRAEDKEEWFPSGKWATIQSLQANCETQLRNLF